MENTVTPLQINGILLIDKPKEITSFDAIRMLKKLLPRKTKIGHGGTLDPFASGLLVIGIGRGTKLLGPLLNSADKSYTVLAKVGEATDTLDCTGTIIETKPYESFPFEQLKTLTQKLLPSYEQTPPIYSSLKHQGQPLHKLVRNKTVNQEELEKIVASKARTCHILSFKLQEAPPPYFAFQTTVSKGTYIRSLAFDIARLANNIATTYELRRTWIGNYNVDRAAKLSSINTLEDILQRMV